MSFNIGRAEGFFPSSLAQISAKFDDPLIDNPLKVVWSKLKEQTRLNLPNFSTANEIRQWIQTKEAKSILFQIKRLDLSSCNLFVLPPEIGQLTALQELNLMGNRLTSLPAEIGQLAALKALNLGENRLTASLPAEIERKERNQELCIFR